MKISIPILSGILGVSEQLRLNPPPLDYHIDRLLYYFTTISLLPATFLQRFYFVQVAWIILESNELQRLQRFFSQPFYKINSSHVRAVS